MHVKRIYLLLIFILPSGISAQKPVIPASTYRTIIADSSLQQRSAGYIRKWGMNRRAEWATPVTVPVLWLDSVYGGLKPYEAGGGNETRSFRLRSAAGKEFTLRSVTKSRDDVVPPDFDGTFVEDIIKDGISSSHPYGAFAVSYMQEKAGIYHTLPVLVYLPQQPALDTFNAKYGNGLYMFEQRPDGNWSDAPNFGYFKDFSSTEKVIEKLQEDNRYKADQYAFIKARLFDMLIGDWDRHEDNWRWGRKDSAGIRIYSPIPRDRDQAFYTHNGKLLDKVLPMAGYSYMQHFDHTIGDMTIFNKEERDFDRFFANEMSLTDWVRAANDLKMALSDTVISQSVQQLPPEIFAVSGRELIDKLRSRREQLVDIASSYYLFIANEVDIIGTRQKEYFEINTTGSGDLAVMATRLNNKGEKDGAHFYNRIFKSAETSEIRIYGIDNTDIFSITGEQAGITIRIIGGPGRDSIIQTGNRIHIYDDRNNSFQTNSARRHLSSDSSIHRFVYENYNYDSKGFTPLISYNYEDRIYVGLNYGFKKYKWRREPFATRQHFGINYSISQNAFSADYSAEYPNLISHWDLIFNAGFDAIRWTNFFGLGNETVAHTKNTSYYRMRSQEWIASMGIRRIMGKSTLELAPFFQRQNIKSDPGNFAASLQPATYKKLLAPDNYGGVRVMYTYASVNHPVVPTSGFTFLAKAMHVNNFTEDVCFQNVLLKGQGYIPLGNKFSLAIKAGGASILGNDGVLDPARIYQHAVIGGPESLRGYRYERFWGKTAFYNNNEFRFITNIKSRLLNAKTGLLVFFDDGRVWMPNEDSDVLHTSYGGGMLFAPFSQLSFTVTYGISSEMRLVQFRINTLF